MADLNNNNQVDESFLQRFGDAWNNHDIESLMSFMADDCVFHTAAGDEKLGTSVYGRESVRAAFEAVWTNFPDVAWKDPMHFVCGDYAVTESTFTATNPDGSKIEARMVDIFTLKDNKILVKNAFRKARPAIPATRD